MERNYAGIFLIACATLLLEISLTRVFSVMFFHHFAFLIISTALFGFGFSGVYLFFRHSSRNISTRLALASLLFSFLIVLCFKAILLLPYGFQGVTQKPANILPLILNYLLLAVPFFFSGYVVGLILTSFPEKAGKYYCFDLIGAALGCLGVLWVVPIFGGSGAVLLAAVLSALAAFVFSPKAWRLRWAAGFTIVVTSLLCWQGEKYFPLGMSRIFEEKHGTFYGAPDKKIEYSAWSPVSRLDVIQTAPNKLIYLDGGSNVSFLVRFNGRFEKLPARMNWRAVPYLISHPESVCIIGPGGGEDVLVALTHRSKSITAVEMDPLMVDMVQNRYREFIGNIFQHPSVELVNDEGRSYLRRSQDTYDLIQTVHNCSPMAFATGAFNLTESYLFTVEAFREYWERLNPEGYLAVVRAGILRAASVASLAMQQEGIPDPENYVLVAGRANETGFYWKKGRISREDLNHFRKAQKRLRFRILYAPTPEYQVHENVYYRLLTPSLRDQLIREADVVLDAPTDNWPFFDHYQRLGQFRKKSQVLSEEIDLEFHNMGDLALFSLLGEALVLSFFFILLPLIRLRKISMNLSQWSILVYFAALGVAFILIEISLIQKHVLFMGQPVYSISTVLFSLLLSAGLGSMFLQSRYRPGRERSWLLMLGGALTVLLAVEVLLVPKLFYYFIGADRTIRFLLSGLFIAPLGFVLGMPFPLGIRILEAKAPSVIPWGWGLNAYTTVVGSVLCVIFAVTWGFHLNFLIALLIYLFAFLIFYRASASS